MKVGVIGAGRLGICFALLLEKAGYEVVASDVREDYIKSLQERSISTNEPEVQQLLSESKNIAFKTGNFDVIKECDILYTLVATPSLSDGSYDVSAVWGVINDIQNAINLGIDVKGKSFIVGCTTNPGDCELFQKQLQPYGVDVFYNPSQTNPGGLYYGRFSPTLNLVDLFEDYSDNGQGRSVPLVTRLDGNENDVVANPVNFDVNKPYKQYDNLSDIFAGKTQDYMLA